MPDPQTIANLIASEDPLSDEAIGTLLGYSEEDDRVDYKITLDPSSEKEWLGLTKDVAAFANTVGGYLIFGVRDSDKEVVGLSDAVATVLADVNNLQQKINRHLEPALGTLRAKAFDTKQGRVVAVYVPRSAARTHLIRKDGEFEFPSGKKSVLVRQGTIYVRRTGGNHLADSRDLDQIIDRRLEHSRETLLSRIAKIVEAPVDSQVFLLKRDVNDPNAKRYVIHDAPDAIPIKGLSFTVAPEGAEEQIARGLSQLRRVEVRGNQR